MSDTTETEPSEPEPIEPEATGVDHRDELPEDLNAAEFVGPYQFPDNSRRRIPGVIYLVFAAGCFALWLGRHGDQPVLVNDGFLFAAVLLGAFGAVLPDERLADAHRREGGAGTGATGRRLPGRPRLGPAGVARRAVPTDLAGALLLGREPSARGGRSC